MSYTPGRPRQEWHAVSTVERRHSSMDDGPLHYSAPSSATWPLQYEAIYVPIRIKQRSIVKKLGVGNGTATSGNFDIGLYDVAGNKLVSSGSTAQAGGGNEQVVDVTDTTVEAGIYYLACVFDNTTATVMRYTPTAPYCAAIGVLTETLGSGVLPSTATWAVDQTHTYYPMLMLFFSTTVT